MDKSVWEIFNEETPKVAEAWIKLSQEMNVGGSLDERTLALIRVGIYSTTRDSVALQHFARMALQAGATKEQVQAAALQAFSVGVSSAELSIPLIKEVTEEC